MNIKIPPLSNVQFSHDNADIAQGSDDLTYSDRNRALCLRNP